MRTPMAILLAVAMSLGLALPGRAADGKDGGLAQACRNIADGEADRMIETYKAMSREEVIRFVREIATAGDATIAELSEAKKDEAYAAWRESLINMPLVILSFCEYFGRGALPGVGADTGHGSLMFGREFFSIPGDGDAGADSGGNSGGQGAAPPPGEGDCAKPYPVTLKLEAGATKHIFCETAAAPATAPTAASAAAFALTASYRADGADGWTRID